MLIKKKKGECFSICEHAYCFENTFLIPYFISSSGKDNIIADFFFFFKS